MVRRKGTFKSKSREYAPEFDPGDGKKGDNYEKWEKKVSMWCELVMKRFSANKSTSRLSLVFS